MKYEVIPENLAIINRVIEEHHTIRNNVKLVGDSINDFEALLSLQKIGSNRAQNSMDTFGKNQEKPLQTLSALNEGLKNHFDFEERFLPQFLGTMLMQGLQLEHREIKNKIDNARSMLASNQSAKLRQEEVHPLESHLQLAISDITRLIERHTANEEVILNMIKRALEEKTRNKG